MTVDLGWEVDHETRDSWVSVLRNALGSAEIVKAPRGWPGWHLAAGRLPQPRTLIVVLWEPGAPRPEGRPVPTPGLHPTILLIVGASGSDVISGCDQCAPDMRTDQETALTLMTLVAHAGQALGRDPSNW